MIYVIKWVEVKQIQKYIKIRCVIIEIEKLRDNILYLVLTKLLYTNQYEVPHAITKFRQSRNRNPILEPPV